MGVIQPEQGFVRMLTGFLRRLVNQHYSTSTSFIDSLHHDIYQLERTLSTASYESRRLTHKPVSVENITEQQKIIDLSG